MSKFDLRSVVESIKQSYGKDQSRASQIGLGDSLDRISGNPEDHVVLPKWWEESYGILGIPFGKWCQISGRPDSGKTSLALLCIKCAQEQGYGIIYVESEGKTGPEDFEACGIDPHGVITVSTNITEEIFEGVSRGLDIFFDLHPEDKLLLCFDSIGNTTSSRDSTLDMTEKSGMVGGAAKSNRLGFGAIRARQLKHDIAVLCVNYSYQRLDFGRGEINAGGRALEFFCSLIIQASRKGWLEKTRKGVKVRVGAEVLWKTSKNHFSKSLRDKAGDPILLPKEITLSITSEGMKISGTS